MVFSRTISLSDGENPGFYLFCPSSFTLSSKIKGIQSGEVVEGGRFWPLARCMKMRTAVNYWLKAESIRKNNVLLAEMCHRDLTNKYYR